MSHKKAAPKSSLTAALNTKLSTELTSLQVPGAVLLVAHREKLLFEKAYGYAQAFSFGPTPLARPEPMTTQHLFDLGSLTKVFATTFGIMLLVDDGILSLDDAVTRYLPQFCDAQKKTLTVRSLLNHSSGLPAWQPLYYHARNRLKALEYIAGLPLDRPLGSARCYSDLGFMVLAAIIEAITDQRLDDFIRDRLYAPLGLRDTTFTPLVHGLTRIAATSHGNPFEQRMIADPSCGFPCGEHVTDFSDWRLYTLKGEVNDANAFHCFGGVAGHAGLFATASDLAILSALLLNEGEYQGRRILKPETIAPFLIADAFGSGLGWAMATEVLHAPPALPAGSFGHTGFTGTSALLIPDAKISIILLTNRQQAGLLTSGQYPDLKKLRNDIVSTVLEKLFC